MGGGGHSGPARSTIEALNDSLMRKCIQAHPRKNTKILSLTLLFGQSGSSSPYKWLCHSVCLSQLASGEVSRVAIGFKAV